MKIDSYKNAVLTGYLHTVLSLFASIFITRYIFNFFDNSEYGVFILIIETIAVFEILDFGFSGGMLSFLSRENNNYSRINKLVSTLFYCQLFLAFLAFFLVLLLSLKPDLLFTNTDVSSLTLKNSILIGAFSLLFTMVTKSISQVAYARRKVSRDNFVKILSLLIRVVLIFGFLKVFQSIEFLIFVILITQVIKFIFTFFLLRKIEPKINFSLKNFNIPILKEVWQISFWFAFGGMSIILIERFDNIMTGMIISTSAITVLVITKKLFDICKSFIFQLNNNYRPYFGKMFGQKNNVQVLNKFKNLSVISVSIACFAGSAIIILNEHFIDLWVGSGKFGGVLLCLFLFYNLVFHSWKITYRAFYSSNLIAKELSISSFIEGLLNLVLAYFLGINYGLEGIVASTFISGIICNLFVFIFINHKYKFEYYNKLLSRIFIQFIFVLIFGLLTFITSTFFNLIIVKILVWIFLVLISIILLKVIFFKDYSFDSILNGKVL